MGGTASQATKGMGLMDLILPVALTHLAMNAFSMAKGAMSGKSATPNAAADATTLADKQSGDVKTAINASDAATANTTVQKNEAATASNAAAINALRAAMSAGSTNSGTILTSGTGAAPAPTQSKTLLGI